MYDRKIKGVVLSIMVTLIGSGMFLASGCEGKRKVKYESQKKSPIARREKSKGFRTEELKRAKSPEPEFAFSARRKIYIYKRGKAKKITSGEQPRYSRDKKGLLFSRDVNGDSYPDEVWIKNLISGEEKMVTKGFFGDWTVKKNEIVFGRLKASKVQLVKKNLASKSELVIKDDLSGLNGLDYVSSDLVVLEMLSTAEEPEIFILNLRSKNFKKLAKGWSPKGSPNGDKIVYLWNSPESPYNFSVFIYELGSRMEQEVTNEERNSFSPVFLDDRRILYATGGGDQYKIYMRNLETGKVTDLYTTSWEVKGIAPK